VYRIEPVGPDVEASVEALVPALLADFAEPRAALEVSPWTVGTPLVPANPTGVVYHVIERERLVTNVQVTFV
jgi:hypothetical protein